MSKHAAAALSIASILAVLLTPASALAQNPGRAEIDALKAEMDAEMKAVRARFDERIRALEARVAGPASSPTPAARPAPAAAAADADVEPTTRYALRPYPTVDAGKGMLAPRGVGRSVAVLPATTDRALQDASSLFQLSASKDSSRVSLKLSSDISEPLVGGVAGQVGWGTTTQWVVTASGALNKKEDRTDVFSIGELNSDFDLKLQWSQRRTKIRVATAADVAPIRTDAIAACKDVMAKVGKEADCEKDYRKRGSGFVADWLGSEREDDYLETMAPERLGFAYGLEGHVGHKEHSFTDSALLKADDETNTPWGVKGFFSLLPANSINSLTGSLEYQRSWKDGKTKILCPTGSTALSVECLNAPVDAPEKTKKLLTGLEWRGLIPVSKKGPINYLGISAQVLYDHKSNEWGLDVPIYLAPDEKGKLIGGVRLGYKSEDDEFKAGVFVGAPFSGP